MLNCNSNNNNDDDGSIQYKQAVKNLINQN